MSLRTPGSALRAGLALVVVIGPSAAAAWSQMMAPPASPSPLPSASPAAASTVRLPEIAWIAGRWVDDSKGHYSEEVWTGPAGGSMMGMWRNVEGGKVLIFELLTLTEEPDGIVLRLRHFDPRLVGREEKDAPVELRLTGLEGARATFAGTSSNGPVQLVYHRTGSRTLSVTLDRQGTKEEFQFDRQDGGPVPSPSPIG